MFGDPGTRYANMVNQKVLFLEITIDKPWFIYRRMYKDINDYS